MAKAWMTDDVRVSACIDVVYIILLQFTTLSFYILTYLKIDIVQSVKYFHWTVWHAMNLQDPCSQRVCRGLISANSRACEMKERTEKRWVWQQYERRGRQMNSGRITRKEGCRGKMGQETSESNERERNGGWEVRGRAREIRWVLGVVLFLRRRRVLRCLVDAQG